MKTFGLAIQLMTRVPWKKQYDVIEQDYAKSAIWFFATSLIVGAVAAAVFFAGSFSRVPYLAAFLSVIAASLVTGGFHIDGFADMCDAFFARKSKEKTLEILKDSRMGTYGVIAIVFVVLVKTLLIQRIGAIGLPALLLLLVAPVCGKIPMVFCAALSSYPRQSGLGKAMIDLLSPATAIGSMLICAAIVLVGTVIAFPAVLFAGAIAIAAVLAAGAVLTGVSKKRIGGATGDILGAANEIGEMVFLLVMAVLV